MKDSSYKKRLVFGIIILFIGASVVPSIPGLFVKKSDQLPIQGLTNFPLSDDYVNAYWKFDEGSGNILSDSSGHDYDGTIYGATWTTGYSSYALDFDGVDDYVNLDTHSQNLGFNKTDDLIFSFYFKSSQYSTGRIYSMSSNLGTNPEIQIFLAPNGTIAFRAIELSCGFTAYTANPFNNNVWHYAKIIYNGITSEPTVTIYVDDVLQSTITHWVCAFYNDDFTRTKIGRRSHDSTDFFSGKLDEFKIIKYPGGNEQDPPTITGPTNGEVGINYDFTFVSNDPEGDDVWYYIDWGDGTITNWFGPYTSSQEVTKSHKWYENGSYNISARSKDEWHYSSWGHYTIVIGNIPPYAPTITGPSSGEIGALLQYKFKAIDNDGDQVSYYIDWGDGTITDWTSFQGSGATYSKTHAWTSAGDYVIKAKAKDTYNQEGEWSALFSVRIGDQAPNKPTITGPARVKTGVEYDFTFKSIDPEGDDVWYEVDWGDGDKINWQGPFSSGFEVTYSHAWANAGTITIRSRAKDNYDKVSDFGTLKIVVPINMPINQKSSQQFYGSLFLKNFQRLLNLQ